MTEIIQTGIVSLAISILMGGLLYKLVFQRMFDLRDQLSASLREELLPDIAKSTQLVTTLSSAAIVLSFSILQGFSRNPLDMKHYLVLSWICFVLAVLFGVFLSILLFVFRANYKLMIKAFSDQQKDKQSSTLAKAGKLLRENTKLEKCFFWSIYIQSLAFASGVVLITIFAVLNV